MQLLIKQMFVVGNIIVARTMEFVNMKFGSGNMDMLKGAIIDETGQYRYSLWRIWDADKPKVTFIMLNGSTADAENDDPTLRRCIAYAKAWGYGSLEVVNAFGYRATLPSELKKADDPFGPENDKYIKGAVFCSDMVVIAWGVHAAYKNAHYYMLGLLSDMGVKPYCLGITKDCFPKHPLYLKSDIQPVLYCDLLGIDMEALK